MDGIIIVNKDKGFTSHDAVAVLRGITRCKKIGHTGTLDPDATGVLPVCLGKATRVAELIMGREKEYRAELVWGSETDTQDSSGTVTAETEYVFDEAAARDAILSFVGEYEQLPPMYSALKVDGKKLYDLARKGIAVERETRPVTILSIDIERLDGQGAALRVRCSKGTYIRTLCEDIGKKTGYLAHLSSLIRTASGPYRLEDAYTLEELKKLRDEGRLETALIGLESLFADLPAFTVPEIDDAYLLNGNYLTYSDASLPRAIGTEVRMYTSKGVFVGLYRVAELLTGTGEGDEPASEDRVRLTAHKMFA